MADLAGDGAPATGDDDLARFRSSTVASLGLHTEGAGDGIRGTVKVTPHMWVPGTRVVRTSVLAVWADSATGLLAGFTRRPRIMVTLDLDLHLRRQPVGAGTVTLAASVIKAGRNVSVTDVHLTWNGEAEPFAIGHASFMASPDPAHVIDGGFPLSMPRREPTLEVPFAEEAGATVLEPGVAEVPWKPENLNAAESIQGGLVALAAEEAALSLAPGYVVAAMTMRYLRPIRSGAARARAVLADDVASVEIEAAPGRLGTVVTAHLAPAAG